MKSILIILSFITILLSQLVYGQRFIDLVVNDTTTIPTTFKNSLDGNFNTLEINIGDELGIYNILPINVNGIIRTSFTSVYDNIFTFMNCGNIFESNLNTHENHEYNINNTNFECDEKYNISFQDTTTLYITVMTSPDQYSMYVLILKVVDPDAEEEPTANIDNNELAIESLNVYPNPFDNSFEIATTNDYTINKVELYNLYGQKVPIGLTSSSSTLKITPTSTLEAGVYIVVVNDVHSYKLVRR